jgi:hypothetical protein
MLVMGYTLHDAAVVTFYDVYGVPAPDVKAFREEMPDHLRHLVVGPFPSAVNGYWTWFFAPDGSNEGWAEAAEADEWRGKFMDLFRQWVYPDGSPRAEVVAVRYGCDHDGRRRTKITEPSGVVAGPDEELY